MPFIINNPETEKLAQQLSAETGESLADAITNSLRERFERIRSRGAKSISEDVSDILRRVDALPSLDKRTDDEILGYDS